MAPTRGEAGTAAKAAATGEEEDAPKCSIAFSSQKEGALLFKVPDKDADEEEAALEKGAAENEAKAGAERAAQAAASQKEEERTAVKTAASAEEGPAEKKAAAKVANIHAGEAACIAAVDTMKAAVFALGSRPGDGLITPVSVAGDMVVEMQTALKAGDYTREWLLVTLSGIEQEARQMKRKLAQVFFYGVALVRSTLVGSPMSERSQIRLTCARKGRTEK